MKKTFTLIFFTIILFTSFAQTPGVKWNRTIRTYNDGEALFDVKGTADGGYISVGTDSAYNYFKPGFKDKFHLTADLAFIVKHDSAGNMTWSKTYSGREVCFRSVALSPDGGYVAAGSYGDYMTPMDTSQFIIVKYNGAGDIVWEKKYGGSLNDNATSIIRVSTGGYLVVGSTNSNDGNVTGNHGPFNTADIWIIKIDEQGSIVWQKCYGGSGIDIGTSVVETHDNYFFVTGKTNSVDGDLNGNNGLMDAWLFKIDNSGNQAMRAHYGGAGDDEFKSIVLNADSSLTVTGYSKSASILSNGYKGAYDLWVARISLMGGSMGTIIWSKGFGGSQDDIGMSVIKTQDNSFLISGYTESNNMDVVGHSGLADAWLVKISNSGNLVWQKCIGTARDEFGMAVVYHSESDFAIVGLGVPASPPGDVTDAFIARLGSAAVLRAQFTSPYTINQGLLTATKPAAQYSGTPFNNLVHLDIDTGQYNVSFTLPNPYYTVTPASHNINAAIYFDTTVVNFTIQPIPGQRDLSITAIPITAARPGFPVMYKLYYKNTGTDTVSSGQILFKRDSRLNFVSASPAVNSIINDTLKWNYINLKPFDSATITVNMTAQVPPSLNIGDTINSLALILPLAGDITPADDSSIVKQVVTGSYDPNDKRENLSGRISIQQVGAGTYINYIIRFQNTGNDTAFNVVVRDTLDSKLDWTTLQMVGASHPYNLQISSQNRLAWNFHNIHLADSFHNEPSSHGFIAYRIKPKSNLVVGDIIRNSASIYFDYNLPVRTNSQETIVINNIVTGIGGPQPDNFSLSIFPNPSGNQIWLKLKDRVQGEAILQVIDMNGREVYRSSKGNINTSNYSTSIDLSNYPAGMYNIVLSVGKKLYLQKLVLQ